MLKFDQEIEEIVKAFSVIVMPGRNDPASNLWPQQPLNKCYFPKSFQYSNLKVTSNPLKLNVEELDILGTSGKYLNLNN